MEKVIVDYLTHSLVITHTCNEHPVEMGETYDIFQTWECFSDFICKLFFWRSVGLWW